jgi:hypothetical protein
MPAKRFVLPAPAKPPDLSEGQLVDIKGRL